MTVRATLLGLLTALALTVLAPVPTPVANTEFASDCAAPTRTLSGGSNQPFSVAEGEVLLLTGGTFTGGINALPLGASLCVAASASLSPAYLNNAAGSIDVALGGAAAFPQIAVATGFDLESQGTVTFAGLNTNGASTIRNLAGGTMSVNGQFSPSAGGIVNDGTFTVNGGLNLNSQAALFNTNEMTVVGSSTLNGQFENTGLFSVTRSLTANGQSTFSNRCALSTTLDFTNNATTSTNDGLLQVGGAFANNGSWVQSATGTSTSASLSNDGRVAGFGRYRIQGSSRTQNSFAGSAASDPIVVDDRTPPAPPRIFDVQSGIVVNVVAATVTSESPRAYPAPGCTDHSRPGGDVVTTKSAPPTVIAGDQLTFTIQVKNNGPDPAEGVVVTDTLPPGLTGASASDGGLVAGRTVTWNLGTLANLETRTLTVTGTAPPAGTLLNRVSSTSTTPDPDPVNNDGTADAANTSTEVEAQAPAPNLPPVADDLTVQGRSETPLLARVTATDPDDGQTLTFSPTGSGAAFGNVVLAASGIFSYRPQPGFAGHDSFDFEVCDNGDPQQCDTGTVSLEIYPVANDDAASTFTATRVDIPVTANDVPGGVVTAVASGPSHGTANVTADGEVEYTSEAGFVGTDVLTYSYCSTDAPPLCATAEVTIEVIAPDTPPVIDPLTVRTTTNDPVSGTVSATDPEGAPVVVSPGLPPRSGTVVVRDDGSFTYTPINGFAGTDSFEVFACDTGDPELCATGRVTVLVFPVAVDDSARTTEGQQVSIPVLGNDLGALNEPPAVVTQPSSGTVRIVGKRIVYTPDPGFTGTDTFTYRVCSPAPGSLCSEPATVTVDVTAAEPEPTPTPTPTPTPPPDTGTPGSGSVAGPTSSGSTSAPSDFSTYGLADTGGPAFALLVGGGLLVILGGAVLLLQRRRR